VSLNKINFMEREGFYLLMEIAMMDILKTEIFMGKDCLPFPMRIHTKEHLRRENIMAKANLLGQMEDALPEYTSMGN